MHLSYVIVVFLAVFSSFAVMTLSVIATAKKTTIVTQTEEQHGQQGLVGRGREEDPGESDNYSYTYPPVFLESPPSSPSISITHDSTTMSTAETTRTASTSLGTTTTTFDDEIDINIDPAPVQSILHHVWLVFLRVTRSGRGGSGRGSEGELSSIGDVESEISTLVSSLGSGSDRGLRFEGTLKPSGTLLNTSMSDDNSQHSDIISCSTV